MTHFSIALPDGAVRHVPAGTSAADIAAEISKSLAKAAIAARWDGVLVDLSRPFERDVALEIVTTKDEEAALELIRHDFAHVMARAVQELWPETKVTIGPVIRDGWYYDFDRAEPFTPEDLAEIEKRMRAIIETRDGVRRELWSRERAIAHYEGANEPFKVELVHAIPEGQDISMYWHGYWMDLCRGPHLVHTAQLPADAFKLMSVAGAYWRGDSKNKQLQRIYGVGFRNKEELRLYLHRLEEAEKRDHRKLGREMDLFHLQDIAPGQVFWHPNGWTVYTQLQDYMRRRQRAGGYVELNTPQVVARSLWEASGHWEKYQENMFIVEVDEDHAREKTVNALKPMNCPCHIQVFNQGLKSYRDLPLRMAEFGSCARYEPSGALHGIMRVRGFTQDDGHIFCTEAQIGSETQRFIDFLAQTYRDLGFESFKVKFSDRPETRAGSDAVWDKAEAALRAATEAAGCGFELNPGEGAFYGPKLEFVLTDAIGRDWQCGTLQVDFVMPERLDASYIGSDGERHRPVMLHRATLGSFERFIGILIEEHAGKFPLWLAPVQVAVASITSASEEAARANVAALNAAGIRAILDVRNEKINYKVREHSLAKVPYILAIGEREAENHSCTVRRLGSKETEVLDFHAFLAMIKAEATPPDQRPDYQAIKAGSGHSAMTPAE